MSARAADAVAGAELGTGRRGLRVLAGPSYFADAEDGGGTLGLTGRLDATVPLLRRAALVASVRGNALSGFREEQLGLTAVAIGLRLQ